jgi:four helix bundle protein
MLLELHRISRDFPKEERFGLIAQIRRAAVSAATTMVEAFERKRTKEKIRLMNFSQYALSETEHYLILAEELDYGRMNMLMSLTDEVRWMLESYKNAIRRGR